MAKIIRALLLGLAIAGAPSVRSEAAPSYKIVEIGADAKEAVVGADLNDRDEAIVFIGAPAGKYQFQSGMRSLLYQGGALVDLKLKPFPEQVALKITNGGRVLGFEQVHEEPNSRTFYLDARKQIHHLVAPGLFEPCAINEKGEIIGRFFKSGNENISIGFWNSEGAFREFRLPYAYLEPVGWMNGSEFLATGYDLSTGKPFVLMVDAKSGKVRQKIRAKYQRWVNAVRGDGAFVGYVEGNIGRHVPFQRVNGHVVQLPLGAGTAAEAQAINGAGAIVGTTYYHTETVKTATLWLNDKSYDLNRLCPNLAGWKLEEAVAINTRGTILCTGKHNGRDSACLLFPLGASKK